MLLRGTAGPFVATTPLVLGVGATCAAAAAGAFFARRSSAHDLGGAGFGGDALGVSSASVFASAAGAAFSSALTGGGDLTDFCVVEAALEGFAGLMGIRGIAGIVVVRVCLGFIAEAEGCGGAGMAEGVVVCVRSTSEGGWEVDGVSTSASEGTATVDASDSSGSSVGVRSPSSGSSDSCTTSSTTCSREGRARPSSSASTGARRLRLRPAARAGNGPGTDSQGRDG